MTPPDAPLLVVATRSPHKLRELRELLRPDRARLVTLDEVGVTEDAIEDGRTLWPTPGSRPGCMPD